MLFPGCRIKVVDSNVVGTTGPIPGSMGFVSNFVAHPNYIDFQRVVWNQYGKKGKPRVETGRFHAVTDEKSDFNGFGKRRVGRVEILGAKVWDSMEKMEFLGWAYSILRLPKSIEQDKLMRNELKQLFGVYLPAKTHRPVYLLKAEADWDAFGSRYMLFKYCRKWREKYYKCKINRIKQQMLTLHKYIQDDCERARKKQDVKHDPVSFALAVINQTLPGTSYRYMSFISSFTHDAILSPYAEQICKGNVWIAEIVKKANEIGGEK